MRISDWSSDVCSSDLVAPLGDIVFEGRNIQGFGSRAMRPLRREMQVVFQDPYGSLSPRMSIAQIVEAGLKVHGIGADAAARDALVVQALKEVDLAPDSRHRPPPEFPALQPPPVTIPPPQGEN